MGGVPTVKGLPLLSQSAEFDFPVSPTARLTLDQCLQERGPGPFFSHG